VNKHLLPIHDKPMIYYPLATLMQACIRTVLVISSPKDLPMFQRLLKGGSHLGLDISYVSQSSPAGIAQALILAESFIADEPFSLILGDNFFDGRRFEKRLHAEFRSQVGAVVITCPVSDPYRFAILDSDQDGRPISITEKPTAPATNQAVTGLYFYPASAVSVAKGIQPSSRGLLEITAVNNHYLRNNLLKVVSLSEEDSWFDAGTHESLREASQTVHDKEATEGRKIGCLEEIAYRRGWIDPAQLSRLAANSGNQAYRDYLRCLL
jgi:glucose-1-phosphate thymidylyltransferase